MEKAGFEGQDGAAFAAGAFGENGYGVAVFQGFGYGVDFGGIAFGAFVAGYVNGLRLGGEIADHRPFGNVVFGNEAAGEGAVHRHNVEPGDVVADNQLAVAGGGQAAEHFELHAAGSEHAQRPQLDGAQLAPFAVKGKQEKHLGHAVKQADGNAAQAEGEADFGHKENGKYGGKDKAGRLSGCLKTAQSSLKKVFRLLF